MATHRVVITDQVFPDTDTERALLRDMDAELVIADGSRANVLELANDADALLNTYVALGSDDLAQLERCKVIARYGIGVDNIDLDAARDMGIAVTNVPDYCVEEVTVHAVSLILALHRKIPTADALVRAGGWGISELRPMSRLSELTVGLVGYGRIARRVGAAMSALGARIVASDPFVTDPGDGTAMLAVDELLRTADVVSLHAPLTPSTRGMIAADQLRRMRSDALLVNTSRGPLVVLDDLLTALREGQIGGAGLDVLESEPLTDPSILEGVPNLIVTPHSAFYSDAAIRESQTKATTQVIKALRGEELDYRVN